MGERTVACLSPHQISVPPSDCPGKSCLSNCKLKSVDVSQFSPNFQNIEYIGSIQTCREFPTRYLNSPIVCRYFPTRRCIFQKAIKTSSIRSLLVIFICVGNYLLFFHSHYLNSQLVLQHLTRTLKSGNRFRHTQSFCRLTLIRVLNAGW